MAIDIQLNLRDNGSIKARTSDAQDLNHELDKQSKILDKLNRPRRASYQQAMSPEEGTAYGIARSTVGTGAASRDFAKQAQGLGGLVHVYATFAANLFAVGAAFRALSDAADTTNMVKGLDQLGANSGKNLGTLSKRLVETTDGAISLREAMTAVAQSSAAGMTANNVLRMGAAAKAASTALGVSMGDAISRLSRGITKLEPELLDELGIFTKLDMATADYARTVGKSAGTLTDFEKRQAFANAVLKEAEEKFGSIKAQANPYDKLLASVKDLSQKGLELVNKVLGPIVELLAKSPLALSAVLTSIGVMLVKQAIPAIGQYRQAVQAAADEALAMVAGRSQAAAKALAIKKKAAQEEADKVAQAYADALDAAQAKYESLKTGKLAGSRARVAGILANPNIYDIEKKDIDYLYKQAERNVKTNKALSDSYREIADTIVGAQNSYRKYQSTEQESRQAQLELDKRSKQTLKEDSEFRSRSQSALTKSIAANAAANVAELGYIAALKKGWEDLQNARKKGGELEVPTGRYKRDEKGRFMKDEDGQRIKETTKVGVDALGALSSAAGVAQLAIGATGAKLAQLAGKAGVVGIVISIIAGTFEVLNVLFSDSEKETAKLNKSYEVLGAAVDNVGKTIDAIRSRNPDKILSVESIQARANAFNELQDSLAQTVKAFEDFGKKQNWWDRSIEGVQRFFSIISFGFSEKLIGAGPRKEMADKLSGSIIAAIRTSQDGPAREKITQELSKLVGFDVSTLDQKGLEEALNKLPLGDLKTKADEVSKSITKFSNDANNAASKLTAFQDTAKQTAKDIDSLSASLALTDNIGKVGTDLVNLGAKMNGVLQDPIQSFTALKEVVDSTQLMSVLPQDLTTKLINTKIYIDDLNKSLGETRENTLKAREELARLQKEKAAPEVISKQKEAVAVAENLQRQTEARAKEVAKQYSSEIAGALFQSGMDKLRASLKMAIEEGAIAAQRGYLSALAAAGAATAESELKLRMQEFDLQKQLIDANYASKLAQEKNTLAVEQNTLVNQLRLETDKLNAALVKGDETARLESLRKLETITNNISVVEEKSKLLSSKNVVGAVQAAVGRKPQAGEEGQFDATKEAAIQLSPLVSTIFGRQAQLAKIEGQKAAAQAEAIYRIYKEQADIKAKALELDIASNSRQLSAISTQESLIGTFDAELAKKKELLEISNTEKTAEKERQNIFAAINTLNDLEGKFKKGSSDETSRLNGLEEQRKKLAENYQKVEQDTQNIKNNNAIQNIRKEEELNKKKRDNIYQIAGYEAEVARAKLDIDAVELDRSTQLGLLDDRGIAAEKKRIELRKIKLDYDLQILDIANKQAELDAKKKETDALAAKFGEESVAARRSQEADEQRALGARKQAVDSVTEAKTRAVEVADEMSEKFVGFSKIVQSSFEKMGDVFVEFAKTGKLNFSGLINSMIADLIRFEMQAQMRSLYASVGGLGGILKMFGFGATNANITNVTGPGGNAAGAGSIQAAKGGAYDMGVQKFAQGGMFTNSLVTGPTLFKFAQGTGLMGEAGPEAIMPLKRDGQGNLGVRTNQSQPKVDVVVNNFSGAKAETKETVDSRGNRKIEVIVGEMVASEVARNNSPMQQALGVNYSTKPSTVRR